MLNKEKFAKEILNIVCNGEQVAVVRGRPRKCTRELTCDKCDLHGNCPENLRKWAYSEYVEPPVNWSKVAVDTPILVKADESDMWKKRYFAGYKDGNIYAWDDGRTSWNANEFRTPWNFVKLAESEKSHD